MAGLPLTAILPLIRRSQVFNETDVFMEQISGIVDGSRKTFVLPDNPLIYDPTGLYGPASPLVIYDAHEKIIDPSKYTVANTKAGAIQFHTAPNFSSGQLVPPFFASYTWGDLDLATLYGACIAGVYEMEGRYYRGFLLADTGNPSPVPNQHDVSITDSAGNDPAGPMGTVFSTSIVQLNFLALCISYRLARDYFLASGKRGYKMKESARGMEVDPSASLKAQNDHLKAISADLALALDQTRAEWEDGSSGMGAAILSPASNSYQTWFSWQGFSQQPNVVSNFGGLV